MTDRIDLMPDAKGFRRVSYTCRYGFVDWGHALPGRPSDPNSLAGLHRQLTTEKGLWPGTETTDLRLNGRPAFLVTYGMGMGKRVLGVKLGMSTMAHWVVQRALSPRQREEVALGMLRLATEQFETFQEKMGLSSGYSAEDLPSNLLGLISLFRGLPLPQLRSMLGEVNVKDSTEVWDRQLGKAGLGSVKNRDWNPRLFPCDACLRGDTTPPTLLSGARYAKQGGKWVRIAGRYIDGALVSAGLPLDVDGRGNVRVGRR